MRKYKNTPQLVQYQGSKRKIAKDITKYIKQGKYKRLVEPFAGTCAITLECANQGLIENFWINDINKELIDLLKECIMNPERLATEYAVIWTKQFEEGTDPIEYFYSIRNRFNNGEVCPSMTLFILARVVKGAIRYNAHGEMNQSCDKRRTGTKPKEIQKRSQIISDLLKDRTITTHIDYKEVLSSVSSDDIIYFDPPYQGTTNSADTRYMQGINHKEFIKELEKLNERGIDFIVSYDGLTGDKSFGEDLPEHLELTHLYIDAGRSAQATLNGRYSITYESLYLSKGLSIDIIKEK